MVPLPRVQPVARGGLTPFLAAAGASKMWKSLAQTLRAATSEVILVHGPSGCGKTRCVQDAASHMCGLRVYEMSASSLIHCGAAARFEHPRRQKRSGEAAPTADDVDGLEPEYAERAIHLIRKRQLTDGPEVDGTDPFCRAVVSIRDCGLKKFRVYAPQERDMLRVAHVIVPLQKRRAFRQSWDVVVAKHVRASRGNLTQLALRLKLAVPGDDCSDLSLPDESVGLFHTTHSLLQGGTSAEAWMRSGDASSLLRLVQENYVAWGGEKSALATVADMADAISVAEKLPSCKSLPFLGMCLKMQNLKHVPQMTLSRGARVGMADIEWDVPKALK